MTPGGNTWAGGMGLRTGRGFALRRFRMPRHPIVLSDKSGATAEITAITPARAPLTVQTLASKAADVDPLWRILLLGKTRERLWTIYQRSGIERGEVVLAVV